MKILSIDVGSQNIKMALIEASFGRLQLVDYFVDVVPAPTNTAPTETTETNQEGAPAPKLDRQRLVFSTEQIETIRSMIANAGPQWDKLVINVPKNFVTTRLYTLPTKDKKVLSRSIGFELEDDLPFELDDLVYDFVALPSTGQQTTVFVSVLLKRDLLTLLSQLIEIDIDPDVVTTEAWSLSHIASKSLPAEFAQAPCCIISLGASQTNFHILASGKPVLSHTVHVGGNHITRAISNSYNLSWEESEKTKIDSGFLITRAHLENPDEAQQLTPDQKKFAQSIEDALIPIVREIRQSLVSFKSQYHLNPKAIYLTGGSSNIPNLGMYLEDVTGIPVFHLSCSAAFGADSLQLTEQTESMFSVAMGSGLAIYKPEKNVLINLRKDEFQKRSGMGTFQWSMLQKPIKYVAASLAFIYANLALQYMILNKRSAQTQESLERSIKAVLGGITRSNLATYMNSESSLKSAVNKEIAKFKPTSVEPPVKQVDAFQVLNKFSGSLPRDIVLDVHKFTIKDGTFNMTGLINQQTDVERVAKFLEETKFITEMNRGTPELDPQSKRFKFNISAKVGEPK